MTFEATIDTLCAYRTLVEAHECFDLLAYDEFPERRVFLTTEAANQLRTLPSSPSEEDPLVPSRDQVEELISRFMRGHTMIPQRDYQSWDHRRGMWKWKTRTTRSAGMYMSRKHFIIARVGFARGLKRDGMSVRESEKDFVNAAYVKLKEIGLANLNWLKGDPHNEQP